MEYKTFNELYSKLGNFLDINVIIHLLQSTALPILIYAIESLQLNKSELRNLQHTVNRSLFKIFRVSNVENLDFCRQMFYIPTIEEIYNDGIKTFEIKLNMHCNFIVKFITSVNVA